MSALPTLIVVLCLVFILLRILPGSVAASLLNEDDMTPEQIEAVEERLGLNKPIWEQFTDYIGGIFSGNWGTSYLNNRDVIENIIQRLEPTIMIAVGAKRF